jgi:glycosyltransferase involved in cell wall biosynthesis
VSTDRRGLSIAFNADLPPHGQFGGVEQNLLGLLYALARFDPDDEFLVITAASAPDWPRSVLGHNMRLLPKPKGFRETVLDGVRNSVSFCLPLRRFARSVKRTASPYGVPNSRAFYEQLRVDVVHFPHQSFERTSMPTVFCPHDLQHLHMPELFDPVIVADREVLYRTGCEEATAIVVESETARNDIVRYYGTQRGKVFVIPTAAPTTAYEGTTADCSILNDAGLTRAFAFYPAVTWPHKNHVRLLEAFRLLRDRGVTSLDLVCTGRRYEAHWPTIEDTISRLDLGDMVHFLGFVSPAQLLALYQNAEFVVIPTLFESVSAPMFEGWHQGTPVACSNVTALPEQAQDAALIFDPLSVESIEAALERLHGDEALRSDLMTRGTRRLARFEWARTAAAYRALYRKAAGRALTEKEDQLLTWNWMAATEEPVY